MTDILIIAAHRSLRSTKPLDVLRPLRGHMAGQESKRARSESCLLFGHRPLGPGLIEGGR